MNQTSLSLLYRLQRSPATDTWTRLFEIYGPLLRAWLRKYDVQNNDADDLVQEVLFAVVRDLKKFDHDGQIGAFRAWLRAILVNRLRNFWRSRDRYPHAGGGSAFNDRLAKLEDPASEISQLWNRDHDSYVMRQLLEVAEPHFAPDTWRAFCRVALEGERADTVAAELGVSLNAVFIAKSRVLSKLRQEARGLIETSSGFFPKS